MPRRRLTDRGRERRDELVRCAIALVGERGVARTTVRDIARAAGVRRSLFYWYFEDFDDLVRFAIADATRRLRRGMAVAIADFADPRERLYVALRECVRMGVKDPGARMLAAAEGELQLGGRYRDELDRAIDTFIADTERLLEEGRENRTFRTDVSTRHLAYCLRSLVHYNLTAYFRGLLGTDVRSLATTIASVGLRGASREPAAADEIASRLERPARAGKVA